MTDEPLEPIETDDANRVTDAESFPDDSETPVSLAEAVTPPGSAVPDELEQEIVPLSEWNDTVVPVLRNVAENMASSTEREQLRQAREEHERLAREAARDDLEEDWPVRAAFLAGPGCYVDATGVYQRPLPTGVKTERYGKTDDALEKDGKVTVSLWTYDAEEEEWSDSDEDQEDVYDSFCYQGLTLPAGVMVKIRHNPENSRWEIVEAPPLVGKTDAALDEDGSVTVSIWDHAGSSWSDTGNNQEDVHDSYWYQGLTLPSGAKVKIRWSIDNKRWEIVEVPRFDGQLSSALASGSSATVRINGDPLTVHAPYLMSDTISSGKKVKIAWEVQNQQWEVDGRECE